MEASKRSNRNGSRDRASGNIERRVVEAALELAAQGGFEAVRQREVAERAGVALGTLYKRFRSKDELLLGVLEVETQKLSSRLEKEPPGGETPLERVGNYFAIATHYFVRKPRLGSAVVRAAASGEKISDRLMAYHAQQLAHVVRALRGHTPVDEGTRPAIEEADAASVGSILLQVWFSALVGWSGGLFEPDAVVEQVRVAARLLLLGIR